MERGPDVHGERGEGVVRHLGLAWEYMCGLDIAGSCLLADFPREERDALAALDGEELRFWDSGAAEQVYSFVVCDDDGAGADGDAVCAGEVVEVRVRDEDVVCVCDVADGEELWECGGAVQPGVEEDGEAGGAETEGGSPWGCGFSFGGFEG